MISKLRFSLIAVIMLVLLGFGFQDQAKGQIGLDGLFCPAVPDTTGWLETEIVGSGADFSAGLIGTVENSGDDLVGGLDWQHVDFTSFYTPTPTNETGSQLVSWWTQKDGRNTYLQVTNADGGPVTVHVRIHNENCVEIRDFCDTYTGYDTHEYNFGDLFDNNGNPIADGNLQGVEGWVTVTAVTDNCGSDNEFAYEHNSLAGQLIVHDSDDYSYGVNTYARWAICEDDTFEFEANLIFNGSFQTGSLNPIVNWQLTQGNAGVIATTGIAPNVAVPLAQDPDALDPDADIFMSFIASSSSVASGTYGGGTFGQLATATLIGLGTESGVSVVQSNVFLPVVGGNAVTYDLSFLAPDEFLACNNYAAVLLIDADANLGDGAIVRANCYSETGNGSIVGNCTAVAADNESYVINPFSFEDGRSNFFSDSLTIPSTGTNYVVQYVTGQIDGGDGLCADSGSDTGALVDNFRIVETFVIDIPCLGPLDGSFNAMLDVVNPSTLSAQFNVLPGNDVAGSDVVLINFADSYGPPYRPVAAFIDISVSIFDADEIDQSCGDARVCFTRLGVDDNVIPSEDFVPPTLTPTSPPPTTAAPTLAPTDTPTPTPTGGGSGSSSCAIAGNPVQLGTALANVLIPLVPVAFAFGVRAVRRRKK